METRILSVQSYDHLSVVQLTTSEIDTFDYISLGRASKEKLIELKEIEGNGSVNNIIVINHSDKFIFMMDGDIIEGAKQNRVINTSILIAPKSKSSILVSCVEQGRWKKNSDAFSSSDYVAPAMLRVQKNSDVYKSLKNSVGYYADQSSVWDKVHESIHKFGIHSETGDLGSIKKRKDQEIKSISSHFNYDEKANGLALFKNNKLLNMDIFNGSQVYQDYFPKLINAAAIDSLYDKKTDIKIDESELKYRTLETLDMIDELEKNKFKGADLGEEERFENNLVTGFRLNYEGKLIHQTVMSKIQA